MKLISTVVHTVSAIQLITATVFFCESVIIASLFYNLVISLCITHLRLPHTSSSSSSSSQTF